MADQENTIGVTNPHDKLFRETYSDLDNALKVMAEEAIKTAKDSITGI